MPRFPPCWPFALWPLSPAGKMSRPKKSKADNECRVLDKEDNLIFVFQLPPSRLTMLASSQRIKGILLLCLFPLKLKVSFSVVLCQKRIWDIIPSISLSLGLHVSGAQDVAHELKSLPSPAPHHERILKTSWSILYSHAQLHQKRNPQIYICFWKMP